MEIIPVIKIKDRKIKNTVTEELIEFSTNKSKDIPLYILDYDGIEKNKPNLCTYQKLFNHFKIWTDNGPSNLGDIVDSYMTGVAAIVIRKNFFKKFDPEKVKYISENKVFLKLDINDKNLDFNLNKDFIDGYVNFSDKEKIDLDFKYKDFLKTLFSKLYVYENNIKNLDYWEKKKIKGVLVDFENYLRFLDAIPS